MRRRGAVWLTRPLADSQRFAELLHARGIPSLIAPLIEIESLPLTHPVSFAPDAIILTSRHAIPALAVGVFLPSTRIYVVGIATEDAVKAAGFSNTLCAPDAQSLAQLILARQSSASHLLYLRGEQVAFDMPHALESHGVTLESRICYRSKPISALPDPVLTALRDHALSAVALFSAYTARQYVSLLKQHGLTEQHARLTCICMSNKIAAELAGLPASDRVVSQSPDMASMLEAITHWFGA